MPVGARKKPYLKRQSELLRRQRQQKAQCAKAKPTFFKFSSAVVNTVFSFEKTNQRTKMYKTEVHQLFRIKYTVKMFCPSSRSFIRILQHYTRFTLPFLYLALVWLFYDNLERSITTSLEDFFMSLSSSANTFYSFPLVFPTFLP